MSKLPYRFVALLAAASLAAGCSSYQPTKNVWKTTKNFWYTYVSPPAEVDYGEKGDLSPRALALTTCMMGIDVELGKLERLMLNADKPPTREWLDSVFNEYPWINGVAGIRADGEIIGQEPAASLKQIDYIPLLYEDKKQSSRAHSSPPFACIKITFRCNAESRPETKYLNDVNRDQEIYFIATFASEKSRARYTHTGTSSPTPLRKRLCPHRDSKRQPAGTPAYGRL